MRNMVHYQSYCLKYPNQLNISQYTLRRVCFPNDWPSDPLWINNSIVQDYHIRTLLQTKRNDYEIEIQKPKSILKPEYISCSSNHNTSKILYGGVKTVSPSEMKVFHYRNTIRKKTRQ